jgi:hypothetical protein
MEILEDEAKQIWLRDRVECGCQGCLGQIESWLMELALQVRQERRYSRRRHNAEMLPGFER